MAKKILLSLALFFFLHQIKQKQTAFKFYNELKRLCVAVNEFLSEAYLHERHFQRRRTLVCNTELNFELEIYLLQQQVLVVETH